MLIICWHLVGIKARRLILVVGVCADEISVHVINAALWVHQKLIWLTLDLYLLHHNVVDHVDRFAFLLIFDISLKQSVFISSIIDGFIQLKFLVIIVLADIKHSVLISRLQITISNVNVCFWSTLRQYYIARLAS